MIELTKDEKARFEQWAKENAPLDIVPADEGNDTALLFNLVHLIRGDGERYNYKPEQDKEIESWKKS